MPRSEIDDIFASGGKIQATASSSIIPATLKKKKKDKKRKRPTLDEDADHAEQPRKRPVPVTVADPSSTVIAQPPKTKEKKSTSKVTKTKPDKKDRKELEQFKDSRGTGPRRKTEEGFAIYKENELGINIEAGGTPLCPFDCECCF